MAKGRLEAFSDGVIAILITIMVLELKVPHGETLDSLLPLVPTLISYVLSFIYLGIYWNNHHHMLHLVTKINGKVLWANLHLLFWLSLVPFVTGWMGENHFSTVPMAAYSFNMMMAGVAYYILARILVAHHGKDSELSAALGRDWKGRLSVIFYIVAIGLAFVNSWIAFSINVLVAMMWLVPDRRIESRFRSH